MKAEMDSEILIRSIPKVFSSSSLLGMNRKAFCQEKFTDETDAQNSLNVALNFQSSEMQKLSGLKKVIVILPILTSWRIKWANSGIYMMKTYGVVVIDIMVIKFHIVNFQSLIVFSDTSTQWRSHDLLVGETKIL